MALHLVAEILSDVGASSIRVGATVNRVGPMQ